MKTYAQIIGIEQVEEVLKGLPKRLNKKLLGQATLRAAQPIKKAAIANVRPYSETVTKQVKTWALKKSFRGGTWVGWKTPKEVKGTRAERAWQARGGFWLEYGASGEGRTGKRRGKQYRRIPAVSWFRRAVDGNIRAVETDFKKNLQDVINRFLNKAIKRYGW